MERTYRVGARTSPLALRQVEEALSSLREFYPDIKTKVVGIDTYGDRDKTTPISDIEGTDFFTREIDEALLRGEIDFAVHSAKDLPDELRDGLVTPVITGSIDPFDALVSKSGLTLDKLPEGARIGTSSLRRKTQLKGYRKDFEIVDIRGNIEERLKKLEETNLLYGNLKHSMAKQALQLHRDVAAELALPKLDAIVIAACGLIRLGLSHRITQRIPLEILKPHPLQGCLAIVVKGDNIELIGLLSIIDSRKEILS